MRKKEASRSLALRLTKTDRARESFQMKHKSKILKLPKKTFKKEKIKVRTHHVAIYFDHLHITFK